MPTVRVHHHNHSHPVEAASAHEAGCRYMAAAAGNPSWGLPRFLPGETVTVEAPDGKLIPVTHEQACRWGNREAERRRVEAQRRR